MKKIDAYDDYILKIKDLVTEIKIPGQIIKPVEIENFLIPEGKIVGLAGESGSGKTMTAYSILDLFPTTAARVREGQILFKDKDLRTLSGNSLRKIRGQEIGMVFQDFSKIFNPVIKIGKQLKEELTAHGIKNQQERIARALDEVGLARDVADRYPHGLSGGMLQRVGIVAALICNPSLVIADEPTTALDVTIQAQILDLLKDLQAEKDFSLLLITHDLGVIADICDYVYIMYTGKIVEVGDVYEIYEAPKHPYTKGLLKGAFSMQGEEKSIKRPIKGSIPSLSELPQGCRFHPRCPEVMERCREQEPPFFNQEVACWLYEN